MENNFTKKIMYECKFCHQLYATTTKHDCKWNPEKRNCLTCRHCVGFNEGRGNIYDLGTLGFIDHESSYFKCDNESSCDDYAEYEALRSNNWNGNCDHYEKAECDNYKRRYAKIMEKQNENSNRNP